MDLREEPRLWTVGPYALGAGRLLPLHRRLKLYAAGKETPIPAVFIRHMLEEAAMTRMGMFSAGQGGLDP